MANSESIVAAAMVVLALLCAVWGGRLRSGVRKGRLNLAAGLLFGGCFSLVGLWNLAGIRASQQIAVTGTVAQLQRNTGQHAASDFVVVPSGGPPVKVRSQYTGTKLAEGEKVVVDVLSFHNTLLHLRVLDGRNAGFQLEESTGEWTSAAVLGLGILMMLGARTRWLRNPED